MTRPIASSSKPPAVVWLPVDSGGLVPVLAARRQMVLLCGLGRRLDPFPRLKGRGPIEAANPDGESSKIVADFHG